MNFRLLIKIIGGYAVVFGLLMLVPVLFSILDGDDYTRVFLLASVTCTACGSLMFLSQRNFQAELDHRTALALVSFAWIVSGVVGALPFYLSGTLSSPLDALFESVSGFTGTGASVIQDVESIDRGILFWRSLTQWLGGMGIIVFFVAVLPALGFGGVQLFRAEVAGPQKDRITPRVKETARKLYILYLFYTVILTVLLMQFGMPWFDAINHSFTTLATGGFSTKNSGIAAFNSVAIDVTLSIFMLLAAINFSLHYRLFSERDVRVFNDTELKWFCALVIGATALMTATIYGANYADPEVSLRNAFFTVSSVVSSTGFSNHDYVPWPPFTHLLIVLLMVMGGMSGSTAGGLKVIRLVAAFKQLVKQLLQVVHPKAVLTIRANQHTIPEHVVDAIWGLIFLYFLVFSVATAVLTAQGIDLLSASTAVFSSLSNIGPALGQLGPSANYASLADLSKCTLAVCMLLGRLEFFTLIVLFTPAYWRR